jgi:hypothetical protein
MVLDVFTPVGSDKSLKFLVTSYKVPMVNISAFVTRIERILIPRILPFRQSLPFHSQVSEIFAISTFAKVHFLAFHEKFYPSKSFFSFGSYYYLPLFHFSFATFFCFTVCNLILIWKLIFSSLREIRKI